MVLVANAVFSYYTILMKNVANVYDSLTLNALVFGLGAILLIPFVHLRWRGAVASFAPARVARAGVYGGFWVGSGLLYIRLRSTRLSLDDQLALHVWVKRTKIIEASCLPGDKLP